MNDKNLTMQVGGLDVEVPPLTPAEHVPSPGPIVEELPSLLVGLPSQVLAIANDLPEILGVPAFTHDELEMS